MEISERGVRQVCFMGLWVMWWCLDKHVDDNKQRSLSAIAYAYYLLTIVIVSESVYCCECSGRCGAGSNLW